MKPIYILLALISFSLLGCKQEAVQFSQVQENPLEVDSSSAGDDDDGEAQGPIVKILKSPSNHKLGEQTSVVFEVEEGDSPIHEVRCFIDNHELSCDWLTGLVKLVGYQIGKHLFEVVAEDEAGLVASAKDKWNIFDRFKRQKEELTVNPVANKTDILFVIDNSGSMGYEQSQIAKKFKNFINEIRDIDFQLAITTTDPVNNTWGDGRLLPFSNGDYYLKSDLGLSKAQSLFSKNVETGINGHSQEQAIRATSRALARAADPQNQGDRALRDFFRQEAAMAVVVVSDEDESGNDEINDGDNLIQQIEEQYGSNKVFQFNSIIVHTLECLNYSGQQMGRTYEQLSLKTNGVVGDICEEDYGKMLKNIGKGVADLQKVYKLKCEPMDINNDGKVDIVITKKGSGVVGGYSIDKSTIHFDDALTPGEYDFNYFCFE